MTGIPAGLDDDEALPLGRSPGRGRLRRTWEAMKRIPNGAGSAAAAFLFVATGAYGVVEGGHGPAVLDAVTAYSGFSIDAVRMTGHRETSDSALLAALAIEPDSSLIAFDVAGARDRLLALPWIATATVQKLFPDTVEVVVTEKAPLARWWDGERVQLIDTNGTVITDDAPTLAEYAALPLFAGRGAAPAAAEFLAVIDDYPTLESRFASAIRVGDRRWDLILRDGPTVRLPADGTAAAVAELARLDQTDRLLSRDITVIDMRLSDRIAVRLTPEAAEARRDALKKASRRKGAST
jgi:cell division protein FtsQ